MTTRAVLEVGGLTLIPLASVLLRDAVSVCLLPQNFPVKWKFCIDVILLILPVQLGFTVMHESWPYLLMIILAASAALITSYVAKHQRRSIYDVSQVLMHTRLKPQRPFITNARSYFLLLTNICILAVDFDIFPIRFAKTKMYGASLMDGGVGCFMLLSHGLVCPDAKGRYDNKRSKSDKVASIKKALMSSSMMLLLGFARLISVVVLDYQRHVTEYGIHWNFFFTIAFVKILASLLLLVVHPRYSGLLTVIISLVYQLFLTYFGLSHYINFGFGYARVNVFDANREGIFSCFGYLALYFAGVQIGRHIFLKSRSHFRDWFWLLVNLIVLIIITACILQLMIFYSGKPTSRKLANFAYVIWMLAHSAVTLASTLMEDLLFVIIYAFTKTDKEIAKETDDKVTHDSSAEISNSNFCLLKAISYNSLLYFLLANLLTGVINMSTDAKETNATTAFIILSVYMVTTSCLITWLYVKKIMTKIW